MRVLGGAEAGGKLQAVLLNAGGAIAAAGHAAGLGDGITVARAAIASGAAAERLDALIAFSREPVSG